MYKLQVVLVPPSTDSDIPLLGIPSTNVENTQISNQTNQQQICSSNLLSTRHDYSPRTANTSANMVYMPTYMGSHIRRPKLKKFLHFTKPTNSLYQLAEEISIKCNKMYPKLVEEPEIITLQDINECDLDPDFVVKDVFNVDNTVRVMLKNDLEATDENETNTLYMTKKRKLNSGAAINTTVPSIVPPSNAILNVAKKRATTIKSSALRVSTPLANQIYPPPAKKQVNSDFEDDDVADKSILPPPAPQSPPIRISSGMDHKKLNMNEDAVSRSETVDPNKARQQRMSSGTPLRPNTVMETPNRVSLVGPTVLSEPHLSSHARNTTTPVITNSRITSGMLTIPEPRISEVEKELGEGPASPSVDLPAKPSRIPMKKPYNPIIQQGDVSSSSDEEEEAESILKESGKASADIQEGNKQPSVRQSSSTIADDNGSPNKNAVNSKVVTMAELPSPRKSSLEKRLDKLQNRTGDEETIAPITRKDDFSDDDSDTSQNGSVVVNRPDTQGDKSFQKSELLRIFNNKKFELPPRFKNAFSGDGLSDNINGKKRKPYLTVLNKDIDNSVPDPRNIMPRRTQRHAAQKAAQFISTGVSRRELESESADDQPAEPTSGDSATDESEGVFLNENNTLKKLNVHPLKESVVAAEDISPTAEPKINGAKNTFKVMPVITPTLLSSTLPDKQDIASLKSNMSAMVISSKQDLNSVNNVATGQKNIEETAKKLDSVPQEAGKTALTDAKTLAPKTPQNYEIEKKRTRRRNSQDVKSKNVSNAVAEKPATVDSISPIDKPLSTANSDKILNQDKPVALKTFGKKKAPAKKAQSVAKPTPVSTRRSSAANVKAKVFQTPKFIDNSDDENINITKPSPPNGGKQQEQTATLASNPTNPVADGNAVQRRGRARRASKSESKSASSTEAERKAAGKQAMDRAAAAASKMVTRKLALNESPADLSPSGKVSKLDELRSKFAKGNTASNSPSRQLKNTLASPQNVASKATSSDADSVSDKSSDNSSEDSSTDDSSEEEEETRRKPRRGIVEMPRGAVGAAVQNKNQDLESVNLEGVPQSTQLTADLKQANTTNAPITRFMDHVAPSTSTRLSSPRTATTNKTSPHRSLSSLSDLASRGVPEVKEKTLSSQKSAQSNVNDISSEESDNDHSNDSSSESDSDSGSSSSDGGNSADDSNNYISAKVASKALGRKKKSSSGFASLIKDAKKR
ncbi:HBR420Cp [Eremothecium sinecaudum]|uniref:HBR420Cp n=1 Tax=Eremothecium sinecaudum TaxID=45286 RepID=A0A120K1G6_9SACH|nr:HBR420Cp [Eremothecium sinecaudum]AMD19321.1 HBR420Cp [Eremothecium sinecaudum]